MDKKPSCFQTFTSPTQNVLPGLRPQAWCLPFLLWLVLSVEDLGFRRRSDNLFTASTMVAPAKGWFRLRNIITLTITSIVVYAIFQLWQNGIFQLRLQTFDSNYDDGLLKRPNVQ